MVVLTLTADHIFRVTAVPDLYVRAPFLKPMSGPALNLHAKIKPLCRSCNKRPINEAKKQLANAFTQLVQEEAAKAPNALGQLRLVIGEILKGQIAEITLAVIDPQGQKTEIKF